MILMRFIGSRSPRRAEIFSAFGSKQAVCIISEKKESGFDMAEPRILIVNVHWLGDVLFSTPAIRALRKHLPAAHLACLVPSRCAPALRHNPYLNEVISYEDRRSLAAWVAAGNLIGKLRKRRFDQAVFFHRSKTQVFLAALAGIKERIGYSTPLKNRSLTRVYDAPSEKIHRIDYFLNLLRSEEHTSELQS